MNKSLILVLTAFVPLAAADEVKLKDGTVYKNCTVEVETPESVSLLVPVSGSIKDSVTVKRDLIESIRKATPDELEAARIGKMYAKPETMNAGDLEKALADLDKTIKKNPQGLAHDAAVKARAKVVVLLEEKKFHDKPYDNGELSDEKKWEWVMNAFSKVTGKNMGPFFKIWRTPVSERAAGRMKDLPAWLPSKDYPACYTAEE